MRSVVQFHPAGLERIIMSLNEDFEIIHHQDGWSDDGKPWLVCCGEVFDVSKHDSYTRFSGWNCPNETAEISEKHPNKSMFLLRVK